MISAAYRQRAAADLKNRITKVLLNGKETPIADISVKDAAVTVLTRREEDVKHIETMQMLDETGSVITERKTNLDLSNNRTLDLRFTFEVV
ncbi:MULTISPECIES: hypothetical protein [Bacillus amyloliquefaciens group]|uniref:hypothetical protein n=1 Tax=Bacillus amyloliquefaciens group TaxID=1938374 RepID=UPI00084A1D97|nr:MULTISPECIES: hypothetical protein [Bacillus amyloliquefaciens group]AOO61227.1 hypothetical protein BBJ33_06730 [Bacillus velezensis]MCT6832402.1 hypothetical protein [Bacillus velezensis]MCT6862174.1 hypothetical protein [Bacillus velezensis]QOX76732.1 hypothetical protein HWH77_16940 [Bacillus velezensis]QVV95051.1 hypothetical protein KHS93_06370 [Bacillus amyloliquefaciens]